MPPPSTTATATASASASASRFAAHWVADALAGDETLNFSLIKALVGVSPESLTGAPEAVRERVALRCLLEVVSLSLSVDGEAAAAPGGTLRVDAARSCEDLLLELIGEVGRSGSLEKDMLPPFHQDIQDFICIKKLALPETSLELLREVNPDITSMGTPSPVEQNDNSKQDNNKSLSNISGDHVNAGNLGCPIDDAQLQQENIDNLVNATDRTNVQKDPMDSTPDFHKPYKLDTIGHDHPEDDTIGDGGVKVSSPDGGARIQPTKKDIGHAEVTMRSILPSGGCNGDTGNADLCIKCDKGGQLLKCSTCVLRAHDSCFGSPITFDDSGKFCCPVCIHEKAHEAYSEARKNLFAFLGTKQFVKQCNDRPTVVQQRVADCDNHLNGCSASKKQDNHQSEANNLSRKNEDNLSHKDEDNLSHKDEEPGRQRKKQKTNATTTSDACPEDVVTTSPRHSEESDEIEATSSNDSAKRSSPPWRNMRHRKASVQEKETAVPSTFRKAFGGQGQHMPSPSRKRNYAPKRYSNPVAPTGRRTKLCWTEEEEATLREAMPKFTPKDDGQIPWIQILEYGRDVFHKTRLPCDLRVKWRNMMKKPGS